ncbi:sulfotransferase domain-containing protein [Salinimicrobium sp. CAU 1759]
MKKSWAKLNPKKYFRKKINQQSERILMENKFYPINQTRAQDVFIAGFPKSGNTWVQNLVSGLLFGIDTMYLPDSLTQELVPDVHYKKVYKRFLDFTCFKTHHLPDEKYRRVIYLTRDPRDVMVSYFFFKKNFFAEVPFEDMIKPERSFLIQWKKHTQEWMKNPYDAEILHIKFEDLVKNTNYELKRMGDFLRINRPEEMLARVVAGNNFQIMQQKENNWGFDNQVDKRNRKGQFFRKGEVGSYKYELTAEQISMIEKAVSDELKKLDYV